MKTVVVFGSGHVARPAIRTLLETGHRVLVATDRPEAARAMIAGFPHGEVVEADATDAKAVRAQVRRGDLTISLLPVAFHVLVAEACLQEGRHFVTTSYVSEEMRALDGAARRAGILLLNEIGADPGIDHMQAMRMIHGVRERGGRVTGLYSVCGGLPAPETNDNPFGYKISWSTRGVALAGKRTARYLEGGEVVHVGPYRIFDSPREVEIDGLGMMESYANGDSIRFIDEYDLDGVSRMFRGSLRWPGWCSTWAALSHLGWVDDAPDAALVASTFADEMRRAAGAAPGVAAREAAAHALQLPVDHDILVRMDWLGLFAEEPTPEGAQSRLDLLVDRMDARLRYEEGERDMLVLYHEIEFEDGEGRPGKLCSSMIEYGILGEDTAMARTVGIPAGHAARRILDGTISLTGVRIPVIPEIYQPILADLAGDGIVETIERV